MGRERPERRPLRVYCEPESPLGTFPEFLTPARSGSVNTVANFHSICWDTSQLLVKSPHCLDQKLQAVSQLVEVKSRFENPSVVAIFDCQIDVSSTILRSSISLAFLRAYRP